MALIALGEAVTVAARKLSPREIANAAASKARLCDALVDSRPEGAVRRGAAGGDPLFPPFTLSPNLTVTDIDGAQVALPAPGAPLVAFAYNASDPWTQAAWANNASGAAQQQQFLLDSVFGAPAANATRYLFASFDASPGGAARDAGMMKGRLTAAMAALAWPEANQTDWLSRATFAADAVALLGGGWVGQLLSNWSNVGRAFIALAPADGSAPTLTVPRLDAAFAWLPPPPPPRERLGVVYLDSAALARGGFAPLAPGAAALVSCGFSFAEPEPRAGGCDGDFERIVAGVEAAGGALAIVVQPRGVDAVEMAPAAPGGDAPAIPATLLTFEHGAALWRAMGAPAPGAQAAFVVSAASEDDVEGDVKAGCTFSVSSSGVLLESGWLGRPSLRFLSWAAQWLDYEMRTQANITAEAVTLNEQGLPADDASAAMLAGINGLSDVLSTVVVPIFNDTLMLGYPGAQSVVALPDAATLGGLVEGNGAARWDRLEVEFSLGCPTPWETGCAVWDRQMQVLVCCGNTSDSTCGGANLELTRYITPFRRGLGHWLTDITPLLPLLVGDQQAPAPTKCLFTAATDAWAMPWTVTGALRLGRSAAPAAPVARTVVPLWNTGSGGNGGANWGVTFDKNYNNGIAFPSRVVSIPSWGPTRATLHAVITGHGSDNNNCAEFCVTTHVVIVAGVQHEETFENAGTDEGCTLHTLSGALPNEHGTWLYGRDGWCDGSAVRPWVIDVTPNIDFALPSFNVSYVGLFNGANPDPQPQTNMPYIIVHIYVAFS
jgi:hypothetical protein